MKRATINDVAMRANVSKSVVSAVFSQKESTIRVSDAVRRHVLEIARAIDYHPNLMAKSLNSHRSFLIGYFCLGGGSWSVSTRMLQKVQQSCQEQGYSLVVYISDSLESELVNLRAARSRQVDAIIAQPYVNGHANNIEAYNSLAASGIPVVQTVAVSDKLPGVFRNCRELGRCAAEKLLAIGHKRITFVVYDNYFDPVAAPSSNAEYLGYLDAMKSAGLPPRVLAVPTAGIYADSAADYKMRIMERAREYAAALFESGSAPTAVIASLNTIGYGVALNAIGRGLKIPEDLSIISCSDDYVLPGTIVPELAVFPGDYREMANAAVAMCLDPSLRDGFKYFKQEFAAGKSICSI